MSEQNLKKYIAELIQEVEKELEEATTTANVDGYQTPHAFSRKKDKERTRKNATQLGYELVDDDVDNITEAGLKGTENIPSNKKLSQLSDTDKLKIVQGVGNLISFKIPSWSRDKKWTVISSGKIVKKKDFDGDIIFFLQGKGPIKASPTYSSVKELLDGVEWDTMELRRESVNEESSEETLRGLKEMAMGDLERIADYADMILDRMNDGQELESWMYSQITLAVDQLNSVHDAMDGTDGVVEERVNLFFEENEPTDAEKWSYAKSQAKQKFDVYPSAYANAWAAKKYKELGGKWKKSEGIHSYSAMSATRAALKKRKKK